MCVYQEEHVYVCVPAGTCVCMCTMRRNMCMYAYQQEHVYVCVLGEHVYTHVPLPCLCKYTEPGKLPAFPDIKATSTGTASLAR